MDGSTELWCATALYANGTYRAWGNCNESCTPENSWFDMSVPAIVTISIAVALVIAIPYVSEKLGLEVGRPF